MTPAQSDELARAFARDGEASVVQAMLANAAASQKDADDRVASVMQSLEEMAEHRVEDACCLMLTLWPVASELMLHEICDGIDLWIAHNRSVTVIEHLKHVAALEVDPDLKRHYEGLLHIEHDAS